jgi:hypothetical protein
MSVERPQPRYVQIEARIELLEDSPVEPLYSGARGRFRSPNGDGGEVVVTLVGASQLDRGDVLTARLAFSDPQIRGDQFGKGSKFEIHWDESPMCQATVVDVRIGSGPDPEPPGISKNTTYEVEMGSSYQLGLAIVVLFAMANFMFGPMTSVANPGDWEIFVLFAMFGLIIVQFPLHAVWLVLSPVDIQIRLLGAFVAAGVWFTAWTCGMIALALLENFYGDMLTEIIRPVFFSLPLIVLAVQTPLWLVRFLLNWRLVNWNRPSHASSQDRFHLRHIFVATAVSGLVIALARLGDTRGDDEQYMLAVLTIAVICGGVSTCTLLPLLVATLRSRRVWVQVPLTILLQWFLVNCVFAMLQYVAPTGTSGGVVFGLQVMFLTYNCLLATVLYLLRLCGYRLAWGRGIASV